MKIQRFNTISSLPASMKITDYVIPDKIYEKSIVDKSCFTTLEDQLAKLTPMSTSEAEQHFDFINGKDDGREMPMRKGSDIAELSTSIRLQQESIKKKIDDAAIETAKQAEHKAIQEKVASENKSN